MKTSFQSVDLMQAVLGFHRDRHAVLSGNLANVDTPGYVPFDLTLERLSPDAPGSVSLSLSRTEQGHIPASASELQVNSHLVEDPVPPGADGNAVGLERELAKIDANRIRYAATAELVSRRLALLRYVAGDGSGG
ncbi:MAG: flagellar basal body rod protein FlgB [Pseudomonadota bacterium]